MNYTLRNILLPASTALLVGGSLWLNAQEMPVPADTPTGAAPVPVAVAPEAPPMTPPVEEEAPGNVQPALMEELPADAEEGSAAEDASAADKSGFLTLEDEDNGALMDGVTDVGANLISITLDDVEIVDVVRMFTRISGANIIATPSNLQGRVTVNLTDVQWKPALESILDMHNLALDEKLPGSGVYRIIPRPAGAPDPLKVQTFFLKYTTVDNTSPVVESMLVEGGTVSVFPSKNVLVVRSTPANLGEIAQLITDIDIPRDQVFIEAKFMELNDEAIKDLGINWQALSGYGIGASGMQIDLSNTRTWEDQRADGIARRDNRGVQDDMIDYYDLYNDKFQDEEVEFVENPAQEGSFVAQSKVEPTRTVNDTIDVGRDITSDLTSTFTKTITDARTAVLSAADFQLVLSALKQMNGISVVSNPKIIVANEEPATIHIGQTERPFVSSVTPGQQGIAPVVTYNPGEPVDLGVKLTVTPTVNTASNITVKIDPELTRFISDAVAPNGQTYPIIAKKTISTVFALDSGKTVAIGGLTETSERDVTSKIPLLGDIPLLGKYLFSHTHKETAQEETIIFVTVGLAMPDSIMRDTGLPEDTELTRRQIIADAAKRRAMMAEIEKLNETAQQDAERATIEEKSELLKRR